MALPKPTFATATEGGPVLCLGRMVSLACNRAKKKATFELLENNSYPTEKTGRGGKIRTCDPLRPRDKSLLQRLPSFSLKSNNYNNLGKLLSLKRATPVVGTEGVLTQFWHRKKAGALSRASARLMSLLGRRRVYMGAGCVDSHLRSSQPPFCGTLPHLLHNTQEGWEDYLEFWRLRQSDRVRRSHLRETRGTDSSASFPTGTPQAAISERDHHDCAWKPEEAALHRRQDAIPRSSVRR